MTPPFIWTIIALRVQMLKSSKRQNILQSADIKKRASETQFMQARIIH
jgi:hypothetical protein